MSSVQEIIASLSSVADKSLSDPERFQLLDAIEKARIALEPPVIALQKLCFSPVTLPVVRAAIGMKLFDVFAANPSAEVPFEEIGSKAAGSADLAVRLVRHLTAIGILEETAKGKYRSRPLGLMLASTSPAADAVHNFYTNSKALSNLNDFLAKNNYANPDDANDTPWQFSYKTDKRYFDWLVDHPVEQKAFNTTMAMHDAYRAQDWFEFYPVAEKLTAEPGRITFVDIGGNTGSDIIKFKAKFPNIGDFVLEDLPMVAEKVQDLPAGIKVQGYDMFTPQPVQGAKAYYLRTVLHDWPDKQAREALHNVKAAMAKDSILLLSENIITDATLTPLDTSVDFTMMAVFAALERTEQHWIDLIKSAGFQINKVYKPTVAGGHQNIALFEATLA